MAVSVWNSACASLRFGVTSCLGTCFLSDFTHEQQFEVLRGLFPFHAFPYKDILQDTLWAVHSLHSKCFLAPAHLREAVGSRPDLSFCVNSYGRCTIIANGREAEWKKISSVEEQERIVFGSFGACESEKLRAPNLPCHCAGSSVGIFLLSWITQLAAALSAIPFHPSFLLKKVLINISYRISKQSTCKLFYISSSTFQIWNISLPLIQKCLRNWIFMHSQFYNVDFKRESEERWDNGLCAEQKGAFHKARMCFLFTAADQCRDKAWLCKRTRSTQAISWL